MLVFGYTIIGVDYWSVAGDDVPDSFWDDLLALRWKENLKLWLTYFSCSEEKKK